MGATKTTPKDEICTVCDGDGLINPTTICPNCLGTPSKNERDRLANLDPTPAAAPAKDETPAEDAAPADEAAPAADGQVTETELEPAK